MGELIHGCIVTYLPMDVDYYQVRLARRNGQSVRKTGTFLGYSDEAKEFCRILNENKRIEITYTQNTFRIT